MSGDNPPIPPDPAKALGANGLKRGVAQTTEVLRERLHHLRERFADVVLIPNLDGQAGLDLRLRVYEDGALSTGYMLMCALSAGIAALGLLQSSTAVVIGAMLISPLMTPIVSLGFGFASLDGRRIRDAAKVVAIGAVIGIAVGAALTWLSPIRDATPEILARTEPTLLDLAIALFSGIAGGYAIVRDKGGTAIGVAIATALMPPLAVVGYGVGTWRLDYAGGAFLLFLTNLAAIAFAIGLIARLSGSAKPFARVEVTRNFVTAGVIAFAILATPLALTLVRVTHEARARDTARRIIASVMQVKPAGIAQLDVKWPLRGQPSINAVVIAPRFRADAQALIARQMAAALDVQPEVSVQQIVAADVESQTRAMLDAAMQRTVAGISSDAPPFDDIRAALGIPVQTVWTNRAEHVAWLVPVAAPGWTLADYRDAEALASQVAGVWRVRIVPPAQAQLLISTDGAGAATAGGFGADLVLWAVNRWGLNSVALTVGRGEDTAEEARARLAPLLARFAEAQVAVRVNIVDGEPQILVEAYGPTPAQRRANAASNQSRANAASG